MFQERESSICCLPVVCRAISASEPVSQYLPVAGGLRFEREVVFVLERATQIGSEEFSRTIVESVASGSKMQFAVCFCSTRVWATASDIWFDAWRAVWSRPGLLVWAGHLISIVWLM